MSERWPDTAGLADVPGRLERARYALQQAPAAVDPGTPAAGLQRAVAGDVGTCAARKR
jgi:hypothetical protein